MTTDYDELMQGVMQLPKEARLLFGHQVISSVVYEDMPSGPSDDEILRRIRESRAGRGKTSDAYEAIDRVRKQLELARNANQATR